MFKDRFQMHGDYIVTPLDGGKRSRREFKGEVKVRVPLIGGRIEKFMMEQLRDSYDIAARVTPALDREAEGTDVHGRCVDFDFQRYVERRRGAREAQAREGAAYAYAGDLRLCARSIGCGR